MNRAIGSAVLALIVGCAIIGTAHQTLELTHSYELVVRPDLRTEAFDTWADVPSASTTPWVRIPDIEDSGIAVTVTESGGFRLIGTSTGRRICERPGECFGTQTGFNSFRFDADEGFEIAVLFRQHNATAGFRIELHSSDQYAHATLGCDRESGFLYTCCTDCYGDGNCKNAGYRTWGDPAWWQDEPHILGLIYEPETRRVRAHIDRRYWIGSATMPVDLGAAHLRLFVQCAPDETEIADYEVLDVVMGLGRK